MNRHHLDPRRSACDELASVLSTPDGLRVARLMQLAGLGPHAPSAPEPREASSADLGDVEVDSARPIGIWAPQRIEDGEVLFVRPDPGRLRDDWCPERALAPKRSLLPLRIALLGESVAGGFFFAPDLTPAKVLCSQLEWAAGPGNFEVVDLSKVDLRPGAGEFDLLPLAESSLQLRPDLLVIFAGNNWYSPLRFDAGVDIAAFHALAPVYREAGAAGLLSLVRAERRRLARTVVREVAALGRAAGIPVIFVLPESNLADWGRSFPVAWLPGDGSPRWHALRIQAERALRAGDTVSAEKLARSLLALDGGACPTSHRILGEALLREGRAREAAAAFALEIEAESCLPVGAPGAAPSVREGVREAAREEGIRCVDLPAIFGEHTGSVPGRDLFLDYCHLTPDGMRVAMAAVAAEVLSVALPAGAAARTLDRRAIERGAPTPPLPPHKDAVAKLLASLYAIHWDRRADDTSPLAEHWIDAALTAWDGAAGVALDYAATRAAPREIPGLSAPERRLFGPDNRFPGGAHLLAGEGMRLRRNSLDGDGITLLARALERHGRRLPDSVVEALLAHHAPDTGVDLTDPFYHASRLDSLLGHHNGGKRWSRGLYRAFWPTSRFVLVADGRRAATIDVTARLPTFDARRTGESARVLINGADAFAIAVGDRWSRAVVDIPAQRLRRGLNEVTVAWPVLPPHGDAAIRWTAKRLEEGIPVDLHPVFGEIFSLVERPAERA